MCESEKNVQLFRVGGGANSYFHNFANGYNGKTVKINYKVTPSRSYSTLFITWDYQIANDDADLECKLFQTSEQDSVESHLLDF